MNALTALTCIATLGLSACAGVSKIDFTHLGRDGWQRPEAVLQALEIRPGDRVADLGAGEGYFVPHLLEAVGASGQVYAVDVDPELTEDLYARYAGRADNLEVVLGRTDDPGLPDGEIDLVLIVNTYHHIEDRPAYFERLRADLSEGGRIAILEPNAELTGVLTLFLDDGHTSRADAVGAEMRSAGYRPSSSFDFLATQIFLVFELSEAAEPDGATLSARDAR
jgi:ubiquinone/menaquinone biosynthesis C-methylase UbiE